MRSILLFPGEQIKTFRHLLYIHWPRISRAFNRPPARLNPVKEAESFASWPFRNDFADTGFGSRETVERADNSALRMALKEKLASGSIIF